ncbi:MAG: hypothetical protein U0835_05870 [Isosphaeraceae bacterium]
MWFRLFDKVFSERNLFAAFQQVASKGARPTRFRGRNSSAFESSPGGPRIAEARHVPASVDPSRAHPEAGNERDTALGIPTVRDRMVQGGGGERDRTDSNATSRTATGFVQRGCKDALRRGSRINLLKAGYTCVVDADLKGYFDSILTTA